MDWKGIREFKVIQEQKGELKLLIVPEENDEYNNNEFLQQIKDRIEQILGNKFTIVPSFTEKLEKTKIGKYRYLDQKMSIKNYF